VRQNADNIVLFNALGGKRGRACLYHADEFLVFDFFADDECIVWPIVGCPFQQFVHIHN
jgi:hypothetical protein